MVLSLDSNFVFASLMMCPMALLHDFGMDSSGITFSVCRSRIALSSSSVRCCGVMGVVLSVGEVRLFVAFRSCTSLVTWRNPALRTGEWSLLHGSTEVDGSFMGQILIASS